MTVNINGAGSLTGLDAVDVPVYADATARNAAIPSPVAGQIVFVTGTGSLVYNGTAWVALGAGAANFTNTATGTYTDAGISYKFITFTGSGDLIVDQAGFADILLVGGAGAGAAGGGGAGGHLFLANAYLPVGTLTATVGAGGAVGVFPGPGLNGLQSRLNIYFSPGGGAGAGFTNIPGLSGASGGGGGQNSQVGGTGIPDYGNNGGASGASIDGSGGGAGASGVGLNGSGSTGGAGGSGTANSITNASVTRAAGGGGCALTTNGAGGSGIGGAGVTSGGSNAGNVNTGSGGGGNRGTGNGGAGGSGVVIVRVVV